MIEKALCILVGENVNCSYNSGLYDENRILSSQNKGTASRGGFIFEGLDFLISILCLCADRFQSISKAFHNSTQLLHLICFFQITY